MAGNQGGAEIRIAGLIFESLDDPAVPLPPPALQVEIMGRTTTLSDFLYQGYMATRGLSDALDLVGRPIASFQSVLDLGCGCGRLLRFFRHLAPRTRLHGSDISAAAIEWDRVNMPFARFDVNGPEPPLPHPDGAFDLAIAISVVTHLPEDLQVAWLAELARVLRPGGVLLISVHGEDTTRQRLRGHDLAEYERKGHHYMKVVAGGMHGLPEFYQDGVHSRPYIERVWTRLFAIRAYIRHGPMYSQELVVLEKSPDRGRPYEFVDLPYCSVGAPTAGTLVEGEVLPIFGTSFFPAGDNADVEVRVDGRSLGILRACIESPEVGKAFVGWPTAGRSTFEGRLPLGRLAPGPHALALHAGKETRMAAASSYFFTP